MAAPVGRPPAFESPEQLSETVEKYLSVNKTPTISGLALYLGFESRQSFYDYEEKPEFTYTIRKLRLYMESVYETRLHSNNPTGAIFWLKNAGWRDKQDIDLTSGGEKIQFNGIKMIKPDDPDAGIHPQPEL